jgi:hypothetical protein
MRRYHLVTDDLQTHASRSKSPVSEMPGRIPTQLPHSALGFKLVPLPFPYLSSEGLVGARAGMHQKCRWPIAAASQRPHVPGSDRVTVVPALIECGARPRGRVQRPFTGRFSIVTPHHATSPFSVSDRGLSLQRTGSRSAIRSPVHELYGWKISR